MDELQKNKSLKLTNQLNVSKNKKIHGEKISINSLYTKKQMDLKFPTDKIKKSSKVQEYD